MAKTPGFGIENPLLKDALAQARTRMEKALGDFRHELGAVRTGRASVTLLEPVKVDYYGTPTPINQLATLSVPEPTMIVVQPYDPSTASSLEKAIRSSDLGLNPVNDGRLIKVPIPPLTEERRKELVKHVHKVLENHRTAVRNIRRDVKEHIEKLQKDKKISEDEQHRSLDDLQKLTDSYIEKLESISKTKEKEILEI